MIKFPEDTINPLNAELNPICHLLALLGGATIVVVSRLRVNILRFSIVLGNSEQILKVNLTLYVGLYSLNVVVLGFFVVHYLGSENR